MDESTLNTIIKNSFIVKGFFAHKISDPKGGYGIQNPFDGFAVVPNTVIFWEAKILKNSIKALNFNKIEEHQYNNLSLITNLAKEQTLNIYPFGIYLPRKAFYLFIFEHSAIEYLKKTEKTSILKKDFEYLIEKELYVNIENKSLNEEEQKLLDITSTKSRVFDVDLLPVKVITSFEVAELIEYWRNK